MVSRMPVRASRNNQTARVGLIVYSIRRGCRANNSGARRAANCFQRNSASATMRSASPAAMNAVPMTSLGQNKIEPAPPPEKKEAECPDDHVIGHVTRRERGPRLVAIGFVRIPDGGF